MAVERKAGYDTLETMVEATWAVAASVVAAASVAVVVPMEAGQGMQGRGMSPRAQHLLEER